jgi:hypothetical protein
VGTSTGLFKIIKYALDLNNFVGLFNRQKKAPERAFESFQAQPKEHNIILL